MHWLANSRLLPGSRRLSEGKGALFVANTRACPPLYNILPHLPTCPGRRILQRMYCATLQLSALLNYESMIWSGPGLYNGTAEMHREEKRCCKYPPGGQIYTPGGHLRVAKASGDRRRKPARPRFLACKVNADHHHQGHHQWQCNTKVSSKGTTRAISWLL